MASQTRSVNNTVSSAWANPDNAFAEDDSCTSTSSTGAQNVYNFANSLFSIPAGNEVYGIVVKTVRGGDVDDYYQIELKDDTAAWRLKNGTAHLAVCAAAVLETLGGEANLWGGTFSRAHVNSADFQVRLTFLKTGKANTLNVDHIEVTVYYRPPSSTDSYATARPFQRKSFYAAGRFWEWYSDGTNLVYRSSTDGLVWSGATSVGACTEGEDGASFFDGTFVHYARYEPANLFYRRGTPQSDGTIDWSALEQIVYDGVTQDQFYYPNIAVDSGGYAWIGVRHYLNYANYAKVVKNANNDGTWSRDFVYQLSTTANDWVVCVVPLTSQRVYVVYAYPLTFAKGQLYDGSWGAEETDLGDYNVSGEYVSATGEGDDVHFAYIRFPTYQIRYNKRIYGVGWQAADELVQDSVTASNSPVLSIDLATGNIYCFWAGSPTANHIYYKKRVSGTWDANPTDWIDESTDALTGYTRLTCFYQAYGGYIGLMYMTKTSSPYYIRFAYLTMAAVYEASARLIGTIIAPYSAPVRLIGSVYRSYSAQVRNIGKVVFPYSSRVRLIGVVLLPFSAQVRNIGLIYRSYSAQVRNIGKVVFPYSSRVRLIGTIHRSYSAQVRNIGSIYRSYSSSVRNIGILTVRVVGKCHAELSIIRRRIF